MLLPGKRVKVTKWIRGDRCVLSTEVDAIRPEDEPDQLYLEPQVIRLLDEMQRLADSGDVDELARHGTVYVRRSA